MYGNGMYRVTRGGNDIYQGGVDGLLEAAREGEVLANDLIFDPTIDKWIFARSLNVLTGFPLKGRRAAGSSAESSGRQETLSEDGLKRRAVRRRALGQLIAVIMILVSALVLIYLIPNSQRSGTPRIHNLVEPERPKTIRIEGTGDGLDKGERRGEGRSNMDSKDVTISGQKVEGDLDPGSGRRAELDPTLTALVATDTKTPSGLATDIGVPEGGEPKEARREGSGTGRSPVGNTASGQAPPVEGDQNDPGADGRQVGGTGDSKAGPSKGTTDPAAGHPGDRASNRPSTVQPGSNGAAQGSNPLPRTGDPKRFRARTLVALPEPKPAPPTPMPLEYRDRGQGRTQIRDKGGAGVREADRQLARAKATLETAQDPLNELDMTALIKARYQARYAESKYGLMRGHASEVARARKTSRDLTKALKSLCRTLHDDAYCDIKSQYPDWPEVVLRSVGMRRALVGMTTDQLEAAWGRPGSQEKQARGMIHCYGDGCSRYARILGGVVVEVREVMPPQ